MDVKNQIKQKHVLVCAYVLVYIYTLYLYIGILPLKPKYMPISKIILKIQI